MIFGQFLSDRPISQAVEVAGNRSVACVTGFALGLARKASNDRPETTWLMVYGGIAIVVGIVTLLDWLGGRQRERRERAHKS